MNIQPQHALPPQGRYSELTRYIVNGLLATAVHYGVLSLELQVLAMPSAGVANLIAALFGITASFLGSRYFVFRNTRESIWLQARKFSLLYASIALVHGAVMALMTDHLGIDFRISFIAATIVQTCLSYAGNKWLVFRP